MALGCWVNAACAGGKESEGNEAWAEADGTVAVGRGWEGLGETENIWGRGGDGFLSSC